MTGQQVPSWMVTKLRPPAMRDEIMTRSRLSRIIDGAIEAHEPLVLVSAPAGAGKSTALACWSASRPDLRIVWMQIDSTDNDRVRFWTALVAGLAAVDPTIKALVEPILKAPKVGFLDHVLPAMVNALDRASDVVIVLDDYHIIESQQLHDELAALIDAAPSHVTIVVSTRHDPPLRLGRLRVRGQLREIRAKELRFDAREATAILDTRILTDAEVATLCEKTEGWAAGLVLASISLARSPDPAAFVTNFAGDNRMVVDYLATELWDSLDDPVQQFFLDISILDRMCGELVDVLLDTEERGAGWLEIASHDNQLLMSLDDHGHWYRFHHLLQEQLQSRLRRDDSNRFATLHRKAATWFEAHGDPNSAIRHALSGGDLELAGRLVGRHGSAAFSEGHLATVQAWLDALGPAVVAEDPWLAILRIWTVILGGDWDNVGEPIHVAQERLEQGELGADATRLRGSLAAAHSRAAIASGDIELALSLSRSAAEVYEGSCLVNGILGMCLTWRGHHDEAVETLKKALTTALNQGEHLIASTSLIFMAINSCARRDPGRARHLAQRALEHADDHQLSDYHQLALAHSVLGRILVVSDPDRAAASGARGVELARRSNEPISTAFALTSQAEIEIASGNVDQASTLLTEARNVLGRCEDPGVALTFLAQTETCRGTGTVVAPPTKVYTLTARELTVLRLLPSRLSVREIASELYVSHNTAKGHLKAIYRKLHVNSRETAVQRARELRLL